MNVWTGVGNIAHTPKVTKKSTDPTLRLSIVTHKLDDNGNDDQQWHSVVLKGAMALYWVELLRKGDIVSIVGEIRYKSFSTGPCARITTSIYASEIGIISRSLDKTEEPEDDEIPF